MSPPSTPTVVDVTAAPPAGVPALRASDEACHPLPVQLTSWLVLAAALAIVVLVVLAVRFWRRRSRFFSTYALRNGDPVQCARCHRPLTVRGRTGPRPDIEIVVGDALGDAALFCERCARTSCSGCGTDPTLGILRCPRCRATVPLLQLPYD